MARLARDFQFSQASLQDFVDCPRRFQLRYVLDVAWPALEAEPALEHERHMQQGAAFHRLVHQHILGLPVERLWRVVRDAADPDLERWWRNYLEAAPPDLPPRRYPEVVLSAPVGGPPSGDAPSGGHRLVAKYDLLAAEPRARVVIVDWKTTRRRASRRWLLERLQTTVYRYVLALAGAHLNGGDPVQPEQVEMRYWFADAPHDPERLPYDAAQFEADRARLAALVADIQRREGDAAFPLTDDTQRCRFCPYRSLCGRGKEAGALDEADVIEDEREAGVFDFDFDQVAEIEF